MKASEVLRPKSFGDSGKYYIEYHISDLDHFFDSEEKAQNWLNELDRIDEYKKLINQIYFTTEDKTVLSLIEGFLNKHNFQI